MKAKVEWRSGMEFESQIRNHRFTMDVADLGGHNQGPTPKETLIASILGCTGMDVVSLLKKYRVNLQSFSVTGNAEVRPTHPKVFEQVDVVYDLKIEFKDRDAELLKVLEAVRLSMTQFCGVSAMVAKVSPIFYTVVINGEIEGRDEASFSV